MTENEMQRIANAIHALRPDWPAASLLTLITNRMSHYTRRDAAVMLAWVACESASTTPARVLEFGPWRSAVKGEGYETPTPPRRAESCFECGRHETACICPGGPTKRPATPAARTRELAAAARAAARGEEVG